ncbi:UTRA domain-containing protein [Woodsholea maritima]|uniref:UTRA domain-containing protein n=1 Tax=Woodsholea maritima TaxID=240237 RepID=UPI00036986C3|nr:UTRA domain-containing protein [Woodsholea maritima]
MRTKDLDQDLMARLAQAAEHFADTTQDPPQVRARAALSAVLSSGVVAQQERLPSERDLQGVLGVSRGTVREVLAHLEAEGVIYRLDRRGWFLSPPRIDYDLAKPKGFMTFVADQGRVPRTETLDKMLIQPSPEIADMLGIAAGGMAYSIRRRRYIDERPVLIEQILVNAARFPGLLERDLDTSLSTILAKDYQVPTTRTKAEMYPTALDESVAQMLYMTPGSPGLFVRRVCYDAKGQVVEYDLEHWHPSAFRLILDSDA